MSEDLKIPSIDDLIGLSAVDDAQISPDGKWVAYTVTRADWKQNEFVSQIWLVPVGESSSRQLTFARASSRSPRWSKDGRWLAFLSKREGDEHTQVYRLSPFGGEAERLSEHETDVSSFEWSPDGRSIAFIAAAAPNEIKKQREESFGEYHVEDEDHVRSHLWLLRLVDRKSLKLTQGDALHVTGLDWNPFHGWIAFEAWPSPDEGDFDRGSIYLLDLDSFGITLLSEEGCSTPRWSPDGEKLAFMHLGDPTYFANNTIRVIRYQGLPSPHELLTGSRLEQTTRAANVSEVSAFKEPAPPQYTVPMDFDEEMSLVDWGLNGLYCSAIQRTSVHLFCVHPDTGVVTRITPLEPDGWVSFGASFDQDFAQAALVASDVTHYSEITVLNLDSDAGLANGTARRLTDFNRQVESWNLGQNEVIRWVSAGGTEIEGILTRPTDFDPQKKYPLLVVIHGGPTWVSLQARLSNGYERRAYPIYEWLARGAIILQPNYRGSAGYGEAFRALNLRNLGLGDCADVVSGVDYLVERGWVDPERVGVMGWSQGGYISAFCTTYASDRFRAASVGAGISNWVTYYVNTDIHPFTRQYLGANPWEDSDIYRSTSPMTYIQRAHTPTLIQHGTADQRVPLPNAYELYQGLRDMGVQVRLVTYPGMRHGPTKPRVCRQIMQENLNWFNRWIWEEPLEKGSQQTCYVALSGVSMPVQAERMNSDLSSDETLEDEPPAYIRDVMHQARRDDAEFCLFSPQDGLIRAVDMALQQQDGLVPEKVLERARQVADQLLAEKIRQLVVFIPEGKLEEAPLFALGCLYLAAGIAGDVKLEQRVVPGGLV